MKDNRTQRVVQFCEEWKAVLAMSLVPCLDWEFSNLFVFKSWDYFIDTHIRSYFSSELFTASLICLSIPVFLCKVAWITVLVELPFGQGSASGKWSKLGWKLVGALITNGEACRRCSLWLCTGTVGWTGLCYSCAVTPSREKERDCPTELLRIS